MNYYMSELARKTYEKSHAENVKRLYEFMMQAADEVAAMEGANPPFVQIMQGEKEVPHHKVSNAYVAGRTVNLYLVYFDLKSIGYADSTRIRYVAKCAEFARKNHICVYFTDEWVGFETWKYSSLNKQLKMEGLW